MARLTPDVRDQALWEAIGGDIDPRKLSRDELATAVEQLLKRRDGPAVDRGTG